MMEPMQQLHEKIEMLLKKYAALQAENHRLKDIIGKQLQSIEALEQQTTHQQIATSSTTEKNDVYKTELKKQIDSTIAEIDKILNTLNVQAS